MMNSRAVENKTGTTEHDFKGKKIQLCYDHEISTQENFNFTRHLFFNESNNSKNFW